MQKNKTALLNFQTVELTQILLWDILFEKQSSRTYLRYGI
jgi:hypothetical protein